MSEALHVNQAAGLHNLFSQTRAHRDELPVFHQAASLNRSAPKPRTTRTIAVAGGKGGVGKTTVAVNLAMAMAMAGRDVMLLDADMGVANIDVQLGLAPTRHVGHMLEGLCTLRDLIMPAQNGLKVIPGGSGVRRLAKMGNGEHAAVIRAFDELIQPPEFLVVDTAAGVADNVAMFAAAADDVLIVVCDELASLTDAYALIKILAHDFGVRRFHIVANMVRQASDAKKLYEKLARVCGRFLNVALDYMGMVPHDEWLRQAIRRQGAVVDLWPSSRAAIGFKQLAGAVDTWGEPAYPDLGRIAFFSGQSAPAAGW
ncbi:site-determining protein [Dyella lipolytica]|uniref:P-loop NTPase n=1 Tax=Dyella lipolytica TaxID=1867835 RepID=A0ABW8IRD5_9GAMM|nr:P-loop NTPase [Dyella lipolytica]GLQ47394.1 site-determining protein [Dyella lipolytica]